MPKNRKFKVSFHVVMGWKLSREVLQGVTRYAYTATNWDFKVFRDNWTPAAFEKVDGIIGMVDGEVVANNPEDSTPKVITYSNIYPCSGIPRVVSDDYRVGVRAAEYYLSLGFSEFAYVSNFPDHHYSIKRYEGFRDKLAGNQIEVENLSKKRGLIAFIRKKKRPLAVLAADDVIAAELINNLVLAGVSVPEEVAVLGVNNDETFCALARVPLSSFGLAAQKIGFEAAKRMDYWLKHGKKPSRAFLIEPEAIIERQSTRSYGVSDVVVVRALQYIRDNATKTIRVEEIAHNCGVGRRTLERRFEELLDRTPHDAVIEARVNNAKKMLLQTDFSIEEIALRSGFSNKRLLSSTFRRILNQTPSGYRKAHQLR